MKRNKNAAPTLGQSKKKGLTKKRIIGLCILAAIVILVAVGLNMIRAQRSKAYVISASDLNNNWVFENDSSTGKISNSATQTIRLEATDSVQQVYVKQGQEVKKGDPLFTYDTTELALNVESAKLDLSSQQDALKIARQQLAQYQKIVPVTPQTQTQDEGAEENRYTLTDAQKLPTPDQVTNGNDTDPADEDENDTNNSETDASSANSSDMTDKNNTQTEDTGDTAGRTIYHYTCSDQTIVTADEWNSWIDDDVLAQLEIPDEGTWTVDGENALRADDGTFISVEDRTQWFPPEADTDFVDTNTASNDSQTTYTAAEKAKMIADKQKEIEKDQNAIALAQNAQAQAQKKLEDATVHALMDGTVTVIGDLANPPKDGSPFCTVSAASGMSVMGAISELDLGTSRVGDKITVTSWETGDSTEATITELADYPLSQEQASEYANYNGNTNVSWYPYTAYMEDGNGFNAGDSVGIQPCQGDTDKIIVLEKGYVRSDSKGAYCMIDDGKGRLKKQRVKTGDSFEGQYVEITKGLTMKSKIAFPYGDTAKIGNRTTTKPQFSLF